ncbi:hypothetical protein ACFYMW_06545 [Streptomyces sp. NPDC006692]|uniref:hypothetical protein n=1 Tax=Streptomyces sp. NPDC006692 TaxID=3364758 RepID=UPI0036C04638
MRRVGGVLVHELGIAEIRQLENLIEDLLDNWLDPAGSALYAHAWELVARVPAGLRKALYEFRTVEPGAVQLVRGTHVDDASLGVLPTSLEDSDPGRRTRREELLLALVAMCLGEPFGRAGEQQGRMVRNVLPPATADEQPNWRTADGGGPQRADYFGLFALRCSGGARVPLAEVKDVRLSEEHAEVLRQGRFAVGGHTGPVLRGAADDPYLLLDPFRAAADGAAAAAALTALRDGLEAARHDLVLEPGSVVVVDNFRAVHACPGRPGHWLKQILVARDLRTPRGPRAVPGSRVLDSDERP